MIGPETRLRRALCDDGFGLIELLIAMTILSIGLMAILATFTSSAVSVNRSGHVNAAAVVTDAQMETYRAMTYDDIGLDSTLFAGVDATYKADTACYDSTTATNCTQAGSPAVKKLIAPTGTNTCATINSWYATTPCSPMRTISGASSPDGHSYRIDTFIAALPAAASPAAGNTAVNCPTTSACRARKQVTVVVRDGVTLVVYARQQTVFDCGTGTSPSATAPVC